MNRPLYKAIAKAVHDETTCGQIGISPFTDFIYRDGFVEKLIGILIQNDAEFNEHEFFEDCIDNG